MQKMGAAHFCDIATTGYRRVSLVRVIENPKVLVIVNPSKPCHLENLKHPNRVENIIILPWK
jgi:hypothetical protein